MGLTLRGPSANGRLEGECWIHRESSGCEFTDARLGNRFRKPAHADWKRHGQSIPLVNTKALEVSFLCCTIQPSSAINARSQKR